MARRKGKKFSKKKEEKGVEKKDSSGSIPATADAESKEISSPDSTRSNDPSWYSNDQQLVIDAASIPSSDALGEPLRLFDYGQEFAGKLIMADNSYSSAIPGVCVLKTRPSLGSSYEMNSPLNMAATALYAHVRYVNSGRKNYDPADLMIYCQTMSDIYAFIMWCKRMYGAAFAYSQRNQYIGKAILLADGINADNLIVNLANFRYWLNSFINRVSSFAVPASIALFQRRAFLYSNVYLENGDGNIKDQIYMFSPKSFLRFAYDSEDLGMLDNLEVPSPANGLTIDQIRTLGESFLANIQGDEDFGLISGDVIKAFDNQLIGLASLEEVYITVPVYDKWVLEQIHNSVVMPTTNAVRSHGFGGIEYDYIPGTLRQDKKGLLVFGHFAAGVIPGETDVTEAVNYVAKRVITLEQGTYDPLSVMEATRLLTVCDVNYTSQGQTSEDGTSYLLHTGADIVDDVELFCFDGQNNNWSMRRSIITSSLITSNQMVGTIRDWRYFKYAPLLYYTSTVGTGENRRIQMCLPFGNIDNYAVVNAEQIARLHEVAMLSLLYVPGVSKLINYSSSSTKES